MVPGHITRDTQVQIGRSVTVYHENVSLMNAIVYFFYDNLDIFVMEVQYAGVISIQIVIISNEKINK
jgi:membrane-bound lytic murein transglycosylase